MKPEHPITKSTRAVAREALRLAQEAPPADSLRYFQKDFTQHQLLAALAVKTDYRGVVAALADFAGLQDGVGQKKAPDHSTRATPRGGC